MTSVLAVLVSFVVAVVATPIMIRLGHRHKVLDHPNERSSHDRPTPRGGGLAIIAAVAATFAVLGGWAEPGISRILLCGSVIALLGLLDDVSSLGAGLKLVVQIGAAAAVVTLADLTLRAIEIPAVGAMRFPFAVGVAISLFWIVGVTNAFNFMDGVNGIASIEAIVCALTYAVMFRMEADSAAVLLCLGIAGGAAGFLVFNARGLIFMGDVGSATLGFVFAVLVLRLAERGTWFIAALLPLLPFLVDTTLTMLRRARRRERLLSAHRSHAYQRLTDLGWSHMTVSISYGLLAASCSVVAVLWRTLSPARLGFAMVFLAGLMIAGAIAIERRARHGQA